jgi:hypothetical protein
MQNVNATIAPSEWFNDQESGMAVQIIPQPSTQLEVVPRIMANGIAKLAFVASSLM